MPHPLEDKVKKELQGNKGLIRKIRSLYIPDTVEMSKIAQANFETSGKDKTDIDSALDELLKVEYSSFLSRQQNITDQYISYADKEADNVNSPETRKIIDEYKNAISSGEESTLVLGGIVKIIVALADSNRQYLYRNLSILAFSFGLFGTRVVFSIRHKREKR